MINTLENLEEVIKQWYLSNGYMNNEVNWFNTNLFSSWKKKYLQITDCTGKTEQKVYSFEGSKLDEVIGAAIQYFINDLNSKLTIEDYENIINLINKEVK